MRANYNARRTSVVLNPRGRVLGGFGRLGENGDGGGGEGGEGGGGGGGGEGGGGDGPPGGGGDGPPGGGDVAEGSIGQTAAEAAFGAATEAAANAMAQAEAAANAAASANAAAAFAQQQADYEAASLAASNAAAYAQQQADYEAVSLAAANAATFAASQIASEAALVAAANALAASRASNAASAKVAGSIATGLLGFLGPIGMIAGLIGKATGFVDKAFENALNGQQLSYDKNISDANQALEDARGYAGDNAVINTEINKVQYNLDMVKKASIEAAVTQMYQTYAKRNPDPAALAYWSQRFGPTITADEVMEFQQMLYANEPNLRPVAVTTQTAAQSSNNLALPIIAAIAGYFIFGA